MRSLAEQEAAHILQLHTEGVASASETRSYSPSPRFLAQLSALPDAPRWLADQAFSLNEQLVEQLVETMRADIEAQHQQADFTSVAVTASPLVKSGQFGPEVEEFTMPLPPNFPAKAGEAKHALRPGLEEYEKLLSKLRVRGLPTTLAEVYEPSAAERLSSAYHSWRRTKEKRLLAELEEALQSQIKLHLLSECCYSAGRRESHLRLPGMVRHHPNDLYTAAALVMPTVDYAFDPAQCLSTLSPPVGRKPTPEQLREYQRISAIIEAERLARELRRRGVQVDSAGEQQEPVAVEDLPEQTSIQSAKSELVHTEIDWR